MLFIVILMMFSGAIRYQVPLPASQDSSKAEGVARPASDVPVIITKKEIQLLRKELHEEHKQRFVNFLDILSTKGQLLLLDKISYATVDFLYAREPKEQRALLEKLIHSTPSFLNKAKPPNWMKILAETKIRLLTSMKDNKEILRILKERNQAFANHFNTLSPKEQRIHLEKRIRSTIDIFDRLSLKELRVLSKEVKPPMHHIDQAKFLEQWKNSKNTKKDDGVTEQLTERLMRNASNHLNTLSRKEQREFFEKIIKPSSLKSKERWNNLLDLHVKYGYKAPKDFYYPIRQKD